MFAICHGCLDALRRFIEQLPWQTFTCPAFSAFIADNLIVVIHQPSLNKGFTKDLGPLECN